MGSVGAESLELVARANDYETAEIIMRQTPFTFTPRHARSVHIAVANANMKMVELFLSFGCPVDSTSFDWALTNIGEPLIDLILKPKERTIVYQDFNDEVLTYNTFHKEKNCSANTCELPVIVMRDIDILMYALTYAAKMNWKASLEKVFDHGVNVSSRWHGFLPPLGAAISGLAVDCVETLISRGTNVNEQLDEALSPYKQLRKQKIYWTPLHAAVRNYIKIDAADNMGYPENEETQVSDRERGLRIVQLLKRHGADGRVLAYDPAAGRPLSFSDRLQSSKDAQKRLKGYATPLDLAQKMRVSEARTKLLEVLSP
jgi:hypothetical protein